MGFMDLQSVCIKGDTFGELVYRGVDSDCTLVCPWCSEREVVEGNGIMGWFDAKSEKVSLVMKTKENRRPDLLGSVSLSDAISVILLL